MDAPPLTTYIIQLGISQRETKDGSKKRKKRVGCALYLSSALLRRTTKLPPILYSRLPPLSLHDQYQSCSLIFYALAAAVGKHNLMHPNPREKPSKQPPPSPPPTNDVPCLPPLLLTPRMLEEGWIDGLRCTQITYHISRHIYMVRAQTLCYNILANQGFSLP